MIGLDRIIELVKVLCDERMIGAVDLVRGITTANRDRATTAAQTKIGVQLGRGLAETPGIFKVMPETQVGVVEFRAEIVVMTREEFERLGDDLAKIRAAIERLRFPDADPELIEIAKLHLTPMGAVKAVVRKVLE